MIEIRLLPNSEVEIIGEISAELFMSGRNAAMKEFSEKVEMAGFRKGKIPEDIMIKNLGMQVVLEKMAVITGPPNPFYVLVAPVITAFFIWGGEMESAALMHRDLGDIWIRSDQVDKAREAYCKEGDICLRWAEELSRESGIIQGEDSEFRAYCLANQYVQKLRLAKEAYQRAESEEDLKKIRRFIFKERQYERGFDLWNKRCLRRN